MLGESGFRFGAPAAKSFFDFVASLRPSLRRYSDDVPFFPKEERRGRTRRGGLRTPLPLLAVIAIAAGIGIAYVSQTARVTQATYQVSSLNAEQQQLTMQNGKLGDDLSRLEASERIVAAAQQLGMKPANSWSYLATSPVPVLTPPKAPANAQSQPSDPMQRLVASLGAAFGFGPGASH